VNHAVFKALLFLGAGSVLQQAHTRNMNRMGGLVKGMPHTAALFLVGSAAAAALPPLNGFASEWMIFQALLTGDRIPPPGGAIGTPLAVGVLALTSGLAAACFVKAFGISFLAMPRSETAGHARDPHWSARLVMGVLAAACIGMGVTAPRMVGVLNALLSPMFSTAAAPEPGHSSVWLVSPTGIAQVSPLLIGVVLVAVMAVAYAFVRARGLRLRYADTWGCGRVHQTPRMEYTSSAFAEPLRRVFSQLYRPTEDLKVSAHPESRYFVRSITYTTAVVPWFEQALYEPLIRSVRATATQVRRLQGGSVHLYLLYVAGALVVSLAATWAF
jgi:hydrogenase-4 component B